MMTENEYPILEFDDAKTATLNPTNFAAKPFDTNKMIITFFPEVLEKLEAEGKISLERTIGGENVVYVYRFANSDVLITLGFVGCPSCGGNLDLFSSMGITKVMFCGGGGVLDRDIAVGQILVVEGAIRDEGFSYHYIKPSKYICTDPKVTDKITGYLSEKSVPYIKGLTWTTDAVFRETADRIAKRKSEGAKIVEMEQAGCIAVAKFRGFDYGALIYGGDDVSGEEWDKRGWRSRKGIRYDLVMLCKSLVEII
ncbi:MAG: nucleoside phosphorylase [Oscillospiraceae bacterium]|nr:nucleoside phosphorylase [Oscillospiraceae bacterium]